jgi:formylglycine-generating enzyme required for sulfatase activity
MKTGRNDFRSLRAWCALGVLCSAAALAGPAQDAVTREVLKEPYAFARLQMLPVVTLPTTAPMEEFLGMGAYPVDRWSPLLTDGDERHRYTCIALTVPEGEVWEFQVHGKPPYEQAYAYTMGLKLGVGADCSSSRTRWLAEGRGGVFSTTPDLLRMTSGGGTYVLRAVWAIAVGNEKHASEGTALLQGRRMATGVKTGRLPPGVVIDSLQKRMNSTAASLPATTPTAAAKLPVGTVFKDCADCPELVILPAGSFQQGATSLEPGAQGNEQPVHPVKLAAPFAMGRHEVTFAQWEPCVQAGVCRPLGDAGWGRGNRPVMQLRYMDAYRFVLWLSERSGAEYFLPTESEWEYAARAGTQTPWNTGDAILADDANIVGRLERTVPVGSFPANRFGLHDMHGNVAEWVRGCVETGYYGVPDDGLPMLKGDCAQRVVRGGHHSSMPQEARSAARRVVPVGTAGTDIGFRVARRL